MAAPIVISILANASQARSELSQTATLTENIGAGFRKMAAPAAIALTAIAAGSKSAIDSASDLREEIAKGGEIFGEQAADIEKFAEQAEQALGQSKRAAQEAASTFGIIAGKAGLAGPDVAAFSKQFTTLASDMASFGNSTPEEAVEAIAAAMRGESEPIRKYGVMLDDATLRARALSMGLIENVQTALTPQQKALAASQEILAQTSQAQGDFARTSEGAANQARINAAETENLSAKLGEQLLPAYEAAQRILSSVLAFLGEHRKATQILIGVVAGLAAGVLLVNAAMSIAGAVTAVYNAVLIVSSGIHRALAAAALGTRLGLLALAIQTTATSVATKIAGVATVAYSAALTAAAAVQRAYAAAALGTRLGLLALAIQTTATSVATKAAAAAQWLWNAALTANPIGLIVAAIAVLVAGLVWFFTQTELGQQIITTVWDAIKTATAALVDAFMVYVNLIVSYWQMVWTGIKWVVDKVIAYYSTLIAAGWNLYNGIVDAFSSAVDWVRGVPGEITSALGNVGTLLLESGKAIMDGLWDGLKDIWEDVKNWFTSITDLIPDFKGPYDKDRRLLFRNGKAIMQSLQDGLKSEESSLFGYLTGVTDSISQTRITGPALAAAYGGVKLTAEAIDGSGRVTEVHKHYAIRVEAVAPGAEVGRAIVASLDEYERSGGRRR